MTEVNASLEDTLAAVRTAVGDTGYMTYDRGAKLVDFLVSNDLKDHLELGFAHGVSTCYLVAATSILGKGHVVSCDLQGSSALKPNLENLLARLGWSDAVTIHRDQTSYTWRLMELIDESPTPRFDFCFIDGAHSWAVDGFAFFLADRLLRPGGWIVFDDLDWTYATSPTMRDSETVREMPSAERDTPQVRKVYELLVKTHPGYDSFRVDGPWAFARKHDDVDLPGKVRVETVYHQSMLSHGAALLRGVGRR